MSPRAVLVGLPGAGKTTTGRRLATRLGVPFADSDALIESAQQRSIPEIFRAVGEDEFRVIEAATIATALADFDGVLALGGGAVLTESTRTALTTSGVPVILLRSSVRTLSRRVGDGHGRPLLAGAGTQQALSSKLGRLASAREPLYREVATHVVSTDRRSSSKVAIEIVELLGVST